MKILLAIIPFTLLVQPCSNYHKPETANSPGKPGTTIEERLEFARQVQPVLVKNCSPCHFLGGKMFEKMPFDQDTTFLHHADAILKRIKDEDENALLRKFVQQNKNGLPGGKPIH